MITTSSVTLRINTKVLSTIKAKAKASATGYQTTINSILANATGVKLPIIVRTKNVGKPKKIKVAKALALKPKKVKAAKKIKAKAIKKKTIKKSKSKK